MAVLKMFYYAVLIIALFVLLNHPITCAFLFGAYFMLRIFAADAKAAARQAFERCCTMMLMLLLGVGLAFFLPRLTPLFA